MAGMAAKQILMLPGDSVRTAIHDFEGDQTCSKKRGHNFALNATSEDVGPKTSAAGGQFVELAMNQAPTSGHLVTAPAWPAHPAWLAQFLVLPGTRIEL